ncbi:hypothetical protein BASA83_013132 [Batrachochytrium salamandrivorans]|nr:hypothetical protein BASA83_013132 [Batrachochytrium salamandrivorans]
MAQAETVCNSSTPFSALHPVANHQLTVNYRLAYSLLWSWVKPTMGSSWLVQQVTPCSTADDNQQGYPHCTGPDSQLSLDPFWLKLGLGSSHSLIGSRVQEQILADTQGQTKDSQATTLVCLMETLRTCGDSASLQKYVTRQLLDTSGFFKAPSFDQSRAHGTRYLMLARMDALWTSKKSHSDWHILVDNPPILS